MWYGHYVEQLTYLLFLKMADGHFDHYRHSLEALGHEKGPVGQGCGIGDKEIAGSILYVAGDLHSAQVPICKATDSAGVEH